MEIFKLSNEELSNIANDRSEFRTQVVLSNGLILTVMKEKNISYDINDLFNKNEMNLDVFEHSWNFIHNNLHSINLDIDVVKSIVLMLSVTEIMNETNELSIFNEKCIDKLKNNNIGINELGDIKSFKVTSGVGENIKTFTLQSNVKINNPFFKFSDVNNQQQITDTVENPYKYRKEVYDGFNDAEPEEKSEKEKNVMALFEKEYRKIRKSVLLKPFTSKLNESIINLLNALYSKELNKDDLLLEKHEVKIKSKAQNELREVLKQETEDPKEVMTELIMNLPEIRGSDKQALYLLFSDNEAINLLKQKSFIQNISEKLANQKIYDDLKEKELAIFNVIDEVNELLDYRDRNHFLEHVEAFIINEENESSVILNGIDKLKIKNPISYEKMNKNELLGELTHIAESLVKLTHETFERIQSAKEFLDWKKDFTEYVESYIYITLMTTVDLSKLSKENLDFVTDLLKTNVESSQRILEKNKNSPILIGMSSLGFANIFYTSQKNVFNNDKELALKDYFIEQIKKPMYVYRENVGSKGILKLNAFEFSNDMFDTYYPAYKYLTIKEAMSIGYNIRFYTPTKSPSYILELENEKTAKYTSHDWEQVVEAVVNSNMPVLFNENKLSKKLQKIEALGHNSINNLITKDVAKALLKEIFTVQKDDLLYKSDRALYTTEKFNQYNKIEDIDFYNTKGVWKDKDVFEKQKNRVVKAVDKQIKEIDYVVSILDNFDNPSLSVKNKVFAEGSRILNFVLRDDFKYYIKAWLVLAKDAQKNNNTEQIKVLKELIPLLDYALSRHGYDRDKKLSAEDHYTNLDYIFEKNVIANGRCTIEDFVDERNVQEAFGALLSTDLMKDVREKSVNVLSDNEKIIKKYYEVLKEDYLNSYRDESGEFSVNKIFTKMADDNFYSFGEENFLREMLSRDELFEPVSCLFKNFDNEFIYVFLHVSEICVKLTGRYNGDKYIINMFKSNNESEYLANKIILFEKENHRNNSKIISEENITLEEFLGQFKKLENTSMIKEAESMKELVSYFKQEGSQKIVEMDVVANAKNLYEKNKNITLISKMHLKYEREKLSDASIGPQIGIDFFKKLDLTRDEKIELFRKNEEKISNLYFLIGEIDKGNINNIYDYVSDPLSEFMVEAFKKGNEYVTQVYTKLREKGWDNQSLYELDLNVLRRGVFKNYADDEIEMLENISTEVFNKVYKKEDFEKNYILTMALNNQIFNYLYRENRNNEKEFVSSLAVNASIENLGVLSEFSLNNVRSGVADLIRVTAVDNLELIISEKNTRRKGGSYLTFEQLASLDKKKTLVNMIEGDFADLQMLTGLSTIKEICNFLDVSKNDRDSQKLTTNLVEKQVRLLLNMIGEEAKEKIVKLIGSIQYSIKDESSEEEKTIVQPQIKSIDEYIDLVKNKNDNMVLQFSRYFSEDLSNILVNEYKRITLSETIDLLNIKEVQDINKLILSGKFDANKGGKYNHSLEDFNHYGKSIIYPLELKKIWFDNLPKEQLESIISSGKKKNLLEFIKIFSLNEDINCLKGDDILEKYLNIYNEYKSQEDIIYYFAHIAFSQEIAQNMGEKYYLQLVAKYGKEFEDFFSYSHNRDEFKTSIGGLLFFEHIDIEKLNNVITSINESEMSRDDYSAFCYYVLGSYNRRNYKFMGEKNISELIVGLENLNSDMGNDILQFINAKADKTLVQMNDSGVFDIFFYESVFGRTITNSEVFNQLILEESNKDLTDVLFKEKVVQIEEEKYFETKAYDTLLINKIGNNDIDQIVLTLKVLEYAESNTRYNVYPVINDIVRVYGITKEDRNDKSIQNIVNRFRNLSKNQYFEELKGFERAKELQLMMDDSNKKAVKSKKKI